MAAPSGPAAPPLPRRAVARRAGRWTPAPGRGPVAVGAVVLVAVLFLLPSGAPSRSAATHSPRPDRPTLASGVPDPAAHPASEPAGTWVNRTSSVGAPPPVLAPAGMAYDVHDGYAVAFGGTSAQPSGEPTGETWRLVNSHWQNLTPFLSTSPPARREGAVFAYDPALNGIVLFGGLGAQGYLGDTWLFSAGQWTDLSGAQTAAPSARDAAMAAYDPGSSSLVLFGGVTGSGPQTDTYALANGVWAKLTPSGGAPPAGCCGAMAYDAADGYLLVALSPAGVGNFQTWSYSGGTWTNRSSAAGPSPRLGMSLDFDAALRAVYLFGGTDPQTTGALNDSWTYSAGTWAPSESSTSRAPSPRWAAGFSATGNNSTTDCLAVFGGFDDLGAASPGRSQTWALCGNSSGLASGPGSSGAELAVGMSISRSVGVVPFQVSVVTRAAGGAGPYNLTICPGTGRCEQALAWDGTSYTSTQLFSSPGTYTVTAVVTDQQGASRATTATVRALAVVPLVAPTTFTPLDGAAPLAVTFQVSVSGGYGPYTIAWSFGDGTNGSSLSGTPVVHTYTSTGSFTPTLRVSDVAGESVNRTLPTVRVVGGAGAGGASLGALGLPLAAAGVVAVAAAVGLASVRRQRRRLDTEARELVDGLWDGRAGPPEDGP